MSGSQTGTWEHGPGELCKFYWEALPPGKGSEKACLELDFPELAEQASLSTCYWAHGGQSSTDTGGFWTNCCKLIATAGKPVLNCKKFVSPYFNFYWSIRGRMWNSPEG